MIFFYEGAEEEQQGEPEEEEEEEQEEPPENKKRKPFFIARPARSASRMAAFPKEEVLEDDQRELRDTAKSRIFNRLWKKGGLPAEAKLLVEEAEATKKRSLSRKRGSYRQTITKISNALLTKKGGRYAIDTDSHPMFAEARQRMDSFEKKVQGIAINTS